MESDAATTVLRHRWGWLFALSVIQIIAGCIAIASPIIASLAAVGLLLGINLIFTGVMYAALALAARSSRPAFAA
ncbi:MAG: hypothetical protein QOD95_2782 [Gammaproteobacteria bacterium]|jgi:uncharacterized membrane protein HdeD (DUF308 family)|nr:hypothetical protein [Gammaproteobacteria bacterium]